ncbi:ABC transporter permease [Enterococcus sp. LJL98]
MALDKIKMEEEKESLVAFNGEIRLFFLKSHTIKPRTRKILSTAILFLFLLAVMIGGFLCSEKALVVDFSRRGLSPSFSYPFGTDWLGRNMLFRTLAGLSKSLSLGMITALLSAVLATIIGVISAISPSIIDEFIKWLIDLMMGIPHLVLLILISFALGGGVKGLMIGVIVTHWMSLSRLVRSEVLQLKGLHYIQASRQFGKSASWMMFNHLVPHLLSVFFVGLTLLLPHVILHESAISFLGFGLPPEEPAIGIILSESMKYVSSGMWWLAVFPGALLVVVVFSFDQIGQNLKTLFQSFES